jgi:hypothetical protein
VEISKFRVVQKQDQWLAQFDDQSNPNGVQKKLFCHG